MEAPSKETVRIMREKYNKGQRVQLVKMNDPQAPKIGTVGTVESVDDVGTVHVKWDNGSSLGVAYGEDSVRLIYHEPISDEIKEMYFERFINLHDSCPIMGYDTTDIDWAREWVKDILQSLDRAIDITRDEITDEFLIDCLICLIRGMNWR